MANAMFGFTMVPLYETLGTEAIQFVLEDSNISSCYATDKTISSILQMYACIKD